ncbi:MAG TPA: hypothetical protein VIN40_08170 [Candidatus Tyrphobacter sp.]
MSAARTLAAALLALLPVTVLGARPIVDLHKFDAYFALFASDSNVPWKATSVRLDTYSSAPVDFTVYGVDPADVLMAGSNERSRAIVTRALRAAARFTYTPPGGYQFQPNAVDLPLGAREGFFVVEARRGNVGEQVWVNRSRIGLVAKQTPAQLLLYGVDLGTGRALSRMRVQLLVNDRFVTEYTDASGTLRWNRGERPIFALAQWGESYAFVSLLPQAPMPSTIVGVRTASAVVHAGGIVRVVGFARTRGGGTLRPARGEAAISLRNGATVIAEQRVPIDRSGAFAVDLAVPPNATAGDDAILAQVAGGVGGASVHVDADAGDLVLDVASACGDQCNPNNDVPIAIRSSRGNVTVRVTVIRSPHVYVGYVPSETPWGTAEWLDELVTTDAGGRAQLAIPHPTDALGSTYGVRVESGGATADTRIVVPSAPVAVRLQLDRDQQSLGSPVGFDVYATDVQSGKPANGYASVSLVHGASVQRQTLAFDAAGHARGAFATPDLGTDLILASVGAGNAAAEDAAQVQVVPQASLDASQGNSVDVSVRLDRSRYVPGDMIRVEAAAPGASGDALLTLEGALGVQTAVAHVAGGRASATFKAVDAPGALQIGAVFVRDGVTLSTTVPLDVDGAGRAAVAALSLQQSPKPGADVTLLLGNVRAGAGTVVVRLTNGEASGSARFDSAPDLLAPELATTQSSAPQGTTWHPWVDSTGNHPLVLGFERRGEPPPNLTLAQADSRAVSWSVARNDGGALHLQLPSAPGRYTLSVLEIADDGRVIAGSSTVDVP